MFQMYKMRGLLICGFNDLFHSRRNSFRSDYFWLEKYLTILYCNG